MTRPLLSPYRKDRSTHWDLHISKRGVIIALAIIFVGLLATRALFVYANSLP